MQGAHPQTQAAAVPCALAWALVLGQKHLSGWYSCDPKDGGSQRCLRCRCGARQPEPRNCNRLGLVWQLALHAFDDTPPVYHCYVQCRLISS